MSENFMYRHHVEPRVKLYSPREESFPIPLNYIDVSRTTHTNLDVKQEKRIDDNWNIDGSRDLSDNWTCFTQFILLEEKRSKPTLANPTLAIVIRPTLANPTLANPTLANPTLANPTLAKPTLANVKVLVVCKDFGFSELIVWVF